MTSDRHDKGPPKPRDGFDLIELIVRVGGALGANQVRLRWKLMRMQGSAQRLERGVEQKVTHVRYRHKVCETCGAVQDREAKVCTSCGEPIGNWWVQVLERIGLATPKLLSISALLGFAIVVVYARLIQAQGGGGIFSMEIETLMRYGAHWPPAVHAGEVWRLGTAIFLHIGIWHLGFNLFALSQIGPALEEVYGRHWALFLFMFTGVIANVGSELFGLMGVAAGASGGLMGLVGVAAGWGHREGTTIGKGVRDRMLKWGLYTMVFGYFIGADNAAHGVGFVSGAVLGYLLRPTWLERGPARSLGVVVGLIGLISAGICIALTLFPPDSPFAELN